METLDELGMVGFLLLLAVILTVLWGAARRIRGPRRPLYAAAFAVLLAWALHAGIDWDWEMPALSLIFFAIGGAVLARRRSPRDRRRELSGGSARTRPERSLSRGRKPSRLARSSPWQPGSRNRLALGLGCLLLAVSPAYVWLAQRRLDAAKSAYNAGNCRAATSAATSSISIVGVNAQAFEILGYCDIRDKMPNLAVAAINKATSLDPNNPDYALDLAVIRAAAGLNPLSAARKAVSLNPRDADAQTVWQSLRSAKPSEWQSDGRKLFNEFLSL
jgi:hypothetical protein